MAAANPLSKASPDVSPNGTATSSGFSRFWRTLKQTFHDVIAGIFAVLALAWLQSALRAWTRDVSPWLVAAAFAVTALMIVFAWTSFRRSRQLR
jgi:ABC-type Fe3+ transport system permease subunit